MSTQRRTIWCVTLLGMATQIGALACSSEQVTGPRTQSAQLDRPLSTVQYGDWECPWYIPPEDCEPLTSDEKSTLYWDIENGIQWWKSWCAEVGEEMQDFVMYGDARKWHLENDGTMGIWQLFNNGNERVSLNDVLFQQGWHSQRLYTLIHEGHHLLYNSDHEGDADARAEECVNW
jgi:hypothetical protein